MIIVPTSDPVGLLKSIYDQIDSGSIETWDYDADGDFTHVPAQWYGLAWLRPYPEAGVLRFGLIGQNGVVMQRAVYSVYHGRFIEMLIDHCYTYFSIAQATSFGNQNVDIFKTIPPGSRARRR
jgi:hypothetical protein